MFNTVLLVSQKGMLSVLFLSFKS